MTDCKNLRLKVWIDQFISESFLYKEFFVAIASLLAVQTVIVLYYVFFNLRSIVHTSCNIMVT